MNLLRIIFVMLLLSLGINGIQPHLHTTSPQEYYGIFSKLEQDKKWKELLHYASELIRYHPDTPFAHEAFYYQGIAYFHLKEYDSAERLFSKYLKYSYMPKFFEDTLYYKFLIAEYFRKGGKKHLFDMSQLPKWGDGTDDALKIYDSIVQAMPTHELAARSLLSKGLLLVARQDYAEGLQVFNQLIRLFPKSEWSIESYLHGMRVYLKQMNPKELDIDLIARAEIHLRRFQEAFPAEPRIQVAEEMLYQMKENYAKSLFDVGKFFERTKKPGAAMIYYSKIVKDYPHTQTAKRSQKRLDALKHEKK